MHTHYFQWIACLHLLYCLETLLQMLNVLQHASVGESMRRKSGLQEDPLIRVDKLCAISKIQNRRQTERYFKTY